MFDVDDDEILDIILGGVDGTCYTQVMQEALKRYNRTESEKRHKASNIAEKTQSNKNKTQVETEGIDLKRRELLF